MKIKGLGRVEIESSLVESVIQMLRSELSADLESTGKEKNELQYIPTGDKGKTPSPGSRDLATSRPPEQRDPRKQRE